jgi:hypothetical protein
MLRVKMACGIAAKDTLGVDKKNTMRYTRIV